MSTHTFYHGDVNDEEWKFVAHITALCIHIDNLIGVAYILSNQSLFEISKIGVTGKRMIGNGPTLPRGRSFADGEALTRSEYYKIFLEDARNLGQRRETTIDFFLTIISLILGAQGYLIITSRVSDMQSTVLIIGVGIFGLFITRIWSQVIRSYQKLLNHRYQQLKLIEEHFPTELQYLHSEDALYPPKSIPGLKSFSAIYNRIPTLAGFALVTISLVRIIAVVLPYLPRLVA